MMFLIPHITFFLVCTFNAAVDGRSTTLSDLGEQYLRNKPSADPVKIIKTQHGDIYDCVDIYKQPAFDHPLLKDHKIQMNPIFSQTLDVLNATSPSPITIGLIEEGCPEGTVPIRRVTKEELTRAATSFGEQFPDSYSQAGNDQPMLLYAGYSTKVGTGPHYAAGGAVNVYNPTVVLGQLSGSVLSVEGGPPEQFSIIRVGWIVNLHFGDGRPRLYTIWGQATDGVMHGCYNTDCPGFVQVDKSIALGMVFDNVSVPGGAQYYVNLQIQLDNSNENWWLIYAGSKKIGYWPNSLFTNLNGTGADIIRWGGQVTSSTTQLPPMGNGKADDSGSLYMALALDDETASSLDDHAVASLEKLETGCYKVGDLYKKDDQNGYRFWFGGIGGDVQQCS